MTDDAGRLEHRELMSVMICMSERPRPGDSASFGDIGLKLRNIELRLSDRLGRNFVADIHLMSPARGLSLLVECKTYSPIINADQIEKYLATTGEQVVLTGVSVPNPREHTCETLFFVLPDVTEGLAATVSSCDSMIDARWGIVEFHGERLTCPHNEFLDNDLSNSFDADWKIDYESIYLDRLPYESDSPDTVIASYIFQALLNYFLQRRKEFTLEDICRDTNPFWDQLESVQGRITNRVRGHMRTIRGIVLKDWLEKVDTGSGREDKWRFKGRSTTHQSTIRAFQARQQIYVQTFADKRTPHPSDYAILRSEQLGFPVVIDTGRYLPLQQEPAADA